MSGTTTDISLNVLCDQRNKQMMFNMPLSRYTPISPYNGNFTRLQLDMRRKVEILKYSNASSSTKTNNLTKAEKYKQLINGIGQTKNYQSKTITIFDSISYNTITVAYPDKLVISGANQTDPDAVQIVGSKGYFLVSVIQNGLLVNCSADNFLPTPTSSCNVPGPIMNLIEDDNVPLYNITNTTINNASYSELQTQTNTNMWKVKSTNNVLLTKNISSYIGSLLITNFIDNPSYNYTLKVPIGIYDVSGSGRLGSANITIESISLNVFYSGSKVELIPSPTISLSNSSFNSPITDISYSELTKPINGYNYFAYVDTINISDIILQTSSGFVYDFYLTVNLSASSSTFNNSNICANNSNEKLDLNLSILTNSLLPPSNLFISSLTNSTINIVYSPPSILNNTILGYKARANNIEAGNSSALSNTITLSGLIPNKVYNLNVSAIYLNGSSTSVSSIVGSTVEFNPTRFALSSTSATSLTVSFIKGGNPNISNYYVIARPDPLSSNSNTVITNTFTNSPITISNLYSGTKYNLILMQNFLNNISSISTNDISGTTLSPPPTSLIITDVSYTYYRLVYTIPNGTTPLGYIVTSTTTSGLNIITDLSNTPIPSNPLTITKLSSGINYTVTITAIYNKLINSFNSTSLSTSVSTSYSAPTNIRTSSVTQSSFYIDYTPPPGTSPYQYNVIIVPLNDIINTSMSFTGITPSTNPILITGLNSGITYTFTIVALYPDYSITSDTSIVTTSGSQTSDLIISRSTPTTLDVTFNKTGNPTGYFSRAVPVTTRNNQTTIIYPNSPTLTTSNYITIPGLTSGTEYLITITSVYTNGNITSNPVSGFTTANPPTNLISTSTPNSFSISYRPPIGSNPIGYNASATAVTTGINSAAFSVSQNPIVITGLSSGTLYDISLSAIYDIGNYDSNVIRGATFSYPSTISGINTNINDASSNSITVYISAPLSGTLPNSYNLIANPETSLNGQGPISKNNITPSQNPISVVMIGLTSGTIYDVSLVSLYSIGTQTSTNTISGTTLAYPPIINSVSNSTINSLTVSFSSPSIGSKPINYSVVANPQTHDINQQTIRVIGISNDLGINNLGQVVINGLASATVYDISMIAVYDIGNITTTISTSGKTTSNAPRDIIITNTTISRIDVSCNAPLGSPPIGYYAIAKPETTNVGQTNVTTPQTSLSYFSINNLYAGTTYDITMVAVYSANSLNNQLSTVFVSGTTLFNSPTITALNKNITDPSINAITVYFNPPAGIYPYYLPNYYTALAVPIESNNRQTIVPINNINNNVTSFVFGGLISGTTYNINMSAVYSVGTSISNTLSATTLFNAPTI